MKIPAPRLKPVLLLFAALTLAACTPVSPRQGPDQASALARAESLAATGQYQQAASLLVKLAQSSDMPDQLRYQLRAAELFLKGRAYGQTQAILNRIQRDQLSGRRAIRYDLISAELALRQAAPARALALLVWEVAAVPEDLRIRFYRLRARALLADGQPLAAARERLILDGLVGMRHRPGVGDRTDRRRKDACGVGTQSPPCGHVAVTCIRP